MTKLTLLSKTYLVFAAIGAVATVSTGLNFWGMSMQTAATGHIAEGAALLRNHMDADMHHDKIRSEVVSIVAAKAGADFNATASARALGEVIEEFEAEMDVTAQFTADPTIVEARAAAQDSFTTFIATGRSISRQTLAGGAPSAAQLSRFQRDFEALEVQMAAISDAVEAYVVASDAEAAGAAWNAKLLGLLSLLCMLGALLVTAFTCRNKLIGPLFGLRESLAEIGTGNYGATVAGCEREDEIGELARSARQLGQKFRHHQYER